MVTCCIAGVAYKGRCRAPIIACSYMASLDRLAVVEGRVDRRCGGHAA